MAAKKRAWKSSRGAEIFILPTPPMMLEGVAADMAEDPEWGARPTPPTYSDVPGEVLEHNETTLDDDDPEIQAENYRQWEDYLARAKAWDAENNKRTMDMIALKSLEIPADQYSLDSEWAETMEILKKKVPESNVRRRLAYVYTEIFASPADIQEIFMYTLELTGVDRGTLQRANEMFRRDLQRRDSGRQTPEVEMAVQFPDGSATIQHD